MQVALGTIVEIDGYEGKYVVVGYKDHSGFGDMSYNETWHVLPLEDVERRDFVVLGEGVVVLVRGEEDRVPNIKILKDIPPFILTKETRYNIKRL